MALPLDQFSQRLAEAGFVHEAELTSLMDALPPDRRPRDGEQLARLLVKQKKLTIYQAQQIYAGKGKSLVLGNYVVLEKLGQGGMGTVLKAEHRRMERIVAIKVLSPSFIKTPGAVQRFQREVKMAARLEHPNIVTAYDADEAAGVHFLVMQYVDGVDLGKLLLQTGPLPIDQAVSYTIQAAQGLAYAHQQGVIHRDVKPSNLLLDRDGVVRVLDMGLARIDAGSDEHDQLTLAGQIMGTVDYMAPEQALDTRAADARADIYSLGATLWHLLTGRTMYQADTIMQKLRAHEREPIPSLAEYCPDVPRELETIFCTMVAKLPEQRYQTMTEVVSQLEHCLAVVPATPRFGGGDPSRHGSRGSRATVAFDSLPRAQFASAPPIAHAPVQQGVIYQASEGDTDPHTNQAITSPVISVRDRSPVGPRSPRRARNLYLALGGSIAVLLAGIVFLIPAKDGTIRVEIGDPQIKVSIKGTDVVLSKADGTQDIALSPGEKTLVVKRGDFVFETDDFTLKKGETVAVRVQLLDGQVEVRRGDQLLGKEKLPLPQPPAETARTSAGKQAEPVVQPSQVTPKPHYVSEDQQAFIDRVARLPAEQQAAVVAEKLQEVNPGFDGVVTHRIADGKVVEYGLSTARVRNIWPLSALTDLRALEIAGFRGDTQPGWLSDLGPLAGLPLQSLACSHNSELRDLTPLKGMQLTTLSIISTSVADLSPLAGMPLTRLECGYSNITDLRPLQGMPLRELVCMRTPIFDLSPLRGMKLRLLNIAGCRKITDFSQLADLSVSILAISSTDIADLSPLRKMPLTRLFCDDTPVADLSPLKDIPLLDTLSITGTAVTDLSPIKDIPLRQLNVDIVPERDVELLRSMKPLLIINMRPAKEFWQSLERGNASMMP